MPPLHAPSRRATVFTATGWEMLLGGGLFLALATVTGAWSGVRPSASGLGALLYLITVGSWIGFTAYIWLLAHVPAAKAATYAYVNPLIAVLLGRWILDEPITSSIIAGSAVIVGAVALVTSARVRRPRAQAAERLLGTPVVEEPIA